MYEGKIEMEYTAYITALFRKLGLRKMYKGCDYIISAIRYMDMDETFYAPVTKVLYVEIAKQHFTSGICVEKNIRSVIRSIWEKPENTELISEIFGKTALTKRPGNIEFLVLLYNYLKKSLSYESGDKDSHSPYTAKDYTFTCPLSGTPCEFCKEFVIETVNHLTDKQ